MEFIENTIEAIKDIMGTVNPWWKKSGRGLSTGDVLVFGRYPSNVMKLCGRSNAKSRKAVYVYPNAPNRDEAHILVHIAEPRTLGCRLHPASDLR